MGISIKRSNMTRPEAITTVQPTGTHNAEQPPDQLPKEPLKPATPHQPAS